MNRPHPQLPGAQPGLLTRVVMAILGGIMLVSAAFLGAVVFLVALGIFSVLALVVGYRVWRIKRQFEKAAREAGTSGGGSADRRDSRAGQATLEGEYVVVRPPQSEDAENGKGQS